jgi:hypothetical protein
MKQAVQVSMTIQSAEWYMHAFVEEQTGQLTELMMCFWFEIHAATISRFDTCLHIPYERSMLARTLSTTQLSVPFADSF